jgi:hypothetical protein
VVVRDGTTTTMVQENVAPALDTAIAQQLLPYFFPNCTGQQRRQRRQTTSKNDWMGRELQGESGSPTVIGVSRLQSDVPISGGTIFFMFLSRQNHNRALSFLLAVALARSIPKSTQSTSFDFRFLQTAALGMLPRRLAMYSTGSSASSPKTCTRSHRPTSWSRQP